MMNFISIGFLLLSLSFTTCFGEKDMNNSGIKIETDKLKYGQSETITITITNQLKEDIYSHVGSGTPIFAIQNIERKTCGDNWEKFFAYCQYPDCITDIDAPQVIKPGQSETMKWKPLLFVKGASKSIQADTGKYRLVISYMDAEMKQWKSEYSNLFSIK